VNIRNGRVRWREVVGTIPSGPLNVSIAAGQSVVVVEDLAAPEPGPTGTQAIDRFAANIPTTGGAFTAVLCDEIGNDLDEVRVSDTGGAHPGWSFGSAFRG